MSEKRTGGDGDVHLWKTVIVSPFLLAADWAHMAVEVQTCVEHGVSQRINVDVFDGVYLDSPWALTFGPQMVQSLRKHFPKCSAEEVQLDIHICLDRPARFIQAMAEAGADRFVFQIEATKIPEEAKQLIQAVLDSGMKFGVSLNPSTPLHDTLLLLLDQLLLLRMDYHADVQPPTIMVDTIDLFAVEPGFGGQPFQIGVLDKVCALKNYFVERHLSKDDVRIMVDIGIGPDTIKYAVEAGANIVVAGTSLFRHPDGFELCLKAFQESIL
jgi:ribulose-phosphate 3-epimerase